LIITLASVLAFAWYVSVQLTGLRELQSEMTARSRKDSLQLLRMQSDLNTVAVAMQEMLDPSKPRPLSAWSSQFARMRSDMDDELKLEAEIAGRSPEERRFLAESLSQFWDDVDRMFTLAGQQKEAEAREEIRISLQARLQELSAAVSRLLVESTEGEQQAATRIAIIYSGVQRQLFLFLTAALVAILFTSLYLIYSNRQIFARIEELSAQRSELAQTLIATQESTLRHISRELHDEFGQVLTAIGTMLGRANQQLPEDSPLHADLQEVRQIAQSTLNNIRELSQALHPVLLEEAGLESTLDWYIPTVERQTGLQIHYEKSGAPWTVEPGAGVHIFRIAQESLNNVERHSGSREAWVRLKFLPDGLELEVEDHGKGFHRERGQRGIGLVAMRERGEILGGALEILKPPAGGALVQLRVPRERVEAHAAA
jgi:signal transduction histidine kinase